MAEIQSFVFWMMGAIVRRTRQLDTSLLDSNSLLRRMSQSNSIAMDQLASEVTSLRALSICKHREFLLNLFPKRFSTEDKKALMTSFSRSKMIFDDETLRRTHT